MAEEDKKPVHTIVLDAGPLIANTPSISTLLKKSEEIFTTPSVIGEIKDATARARLDTLVMPFITLKTPKTDSMKFVTEFARKTGDLAVLSRTDLEVIALAYELECERNGGDWRLRRTPGQKTVNGAPPSKEQNTEPGQTSTPTITNEVSNENVPTQDAAQAVIQDDMLNASAALSGLNLEQGPRETHVNLPGQTYASPVVDGEASSSRDVINGTVITATKPSETTSQVQASESATVADLTKPEDDRLLSEEQQRPDASQAAQSASESGSDEDSDGGEWITPSNISRHKVATDSSSTNTPSRPKTLQVATLTTDHTLQNTLLLINLNLLSSSLTRIAHVKSHILRCHACFSTTKQMEKQFCPRCGQPTLTRVTASTNANGTTTLHLKKNMQWNTRGDRYSIPKPVAGSSNGKMREKGGGKGGWGRGLILAEDQKEYTRAVQDRDREKRKAQKDMLDQDFLPGLMSGDRSHGVGGRIQIGGGRTVNSKKR